MTTERENKKKRCDCHLHERQVCDICQGVVTENKGKPEQKGEDALDVEQLAAEAVGYLRYCPSRATVAQKEMWEKVVALCARVESEAYKRGEAEGVKKSAEVCTEKFPCHDPHHDERWCSTCEAGNTRADLIEQKILELKDKSQ